MKMENLIYFVLLMIKLLFNSALQLHAKYERSKHNIALWLLGPPTCNNKHK